MLLAYAEAGHGPPVLLLHGFTGTGHTDFATLTPPLAQEFRVIAPDLRGYGASQPPTRDFPPDFYARDAADAAELIEALDCGPVAVMGFSDGGESALLLAATRPDLVRAAVVWGVCGVIDPAMVAAVERWLPVSAWGPERAAWRDEIIALHGEAQFAPMIEGWVHAARAIAAAGGNIVLAQAANIQCPTLILHGEDDRGNPVAAVRKLAARIPHCTLQILPGVGHGVHHEAQDTLLAAALPFLRT